MPGLAKAVSGYAAESYRALVDELAIPKETLRDEEIELVPYDRSSVNRLFRLGADYPQALELELGRFVDTDLAKAREYMSKWERRIKALSRVWAFGIGGAWLAYGPQLGGVAYAIRSKDGSLAAIRGCRFVETESEAQEARVIRLVADWTRRTLGVDYPYVQIPCHNDWAIRCAEAAGVPWHPGEPTLPPTPPSMIRLRRAESDRDCMHVSNVSGRPRGR